MIQVAPRKEAPKVALMKPFMAWRDWIFLIRRDLKLSAWGYVLGRLAEGRLHKALNAWRFAARMWQMSPPQLDKTVQVSCFSCHDVAVQTLPLARPLHFNLAAEDDSGAESNGDAESGYHGSSSSWSSSSSSKDSLDSEELWWVERVPAARAASPGSQLRSMLLARMHLLEGPEIATMAILGWWPALAVTGRPLLVKSVDVKNLLTLISTTVDYEVAQVEYNVGGELEVRAPSPCDFLTDLFVEHNTFLNFPRPSPPARS